MTVLNILKPGPGWSLLFDIYIHFLIFRYTLRKHVFLKLRILRNSYTTKYIRVETEWKRGTHHPCVRSRKDSPRCPSAVSWAAGAAGGRRPSWAPPELVWVDARAWNCKIVENYCCKKLGLTTLALFHTPTTFTEIRKEEPKIKSMILFLFLLFIQNYK